jgi:hypothetical protein
MLGSAVDEQRFQRHEKISRRVDNANVGVPALMSMLALAKFRAQFFQYTPGVGQFGAADFQPLEFGQKIVACHGRQPLQIILNPIGLHHGMRFPQSDRVSDRPPSTDIAAGTRG